MSKPSKLDEAIEVIRGLLYAEEDWNDRAEAFLAEVGQGSTPTAPAATAPPRPHPRAPSLRPNGATRACPDCGAEFQETNARNGSAASKLATHVRFSTVPHPKARAAGIR